MQQLTTICSAQPSACDGSFTDTTLNLTSLQLGGTVPTELASLTNLVQLELWNNSLSGTVPTFLSALTALSVQGLKTIIKAALCSVLTYEM